MALQGNQILFASLMGSEIVGKLPRFSLVQNEISKHVLPPIPFIGEVNSSQVAKVISKNLSGTNNIVNSSIENQFFPLSFRRKLPNEPWYTLPYEPLVNITGKNIIVKRTVARNDKIIGTVKERFAQDDYQITITGFLMGAIEKGNVQDCFPRVEFERLRDYCKSGLVEIRLAPLEMLNISEIVIEDFDFPFTKGENVQAYELTAYSDFTSDFLLEIKE
jgi:hypothetical protein